VISGRFGHFFHDFSFPFTNRLVSANPKFTACGLRSGVSVHKISTAYYSWIRIYGKSSKGNSNFDKTPKFWFQWYARTTQATMTKFLAQGSIICSHITASYVKFTSAVPEKDEKWPLYVITYSEIEWPQKMPCSFRTAWFSAMLSLANVHVRCWPTIHLSRISPSSLVLARLKTYVTKPTSCIGLELHP
jgi:hypothetical protein